MNTSAGTLDQPSWTWGGLIKGVVKIAAVVAVGVGLFFGGAYGAEQLGLVSEGTTGKYWGVATSAVGSFAGLQDAVGSAVDSVFGSGTTEKLAENANAATEKATELVEKAKSVLGIGDFGIPDITNLDISELPSADLEAVKNYFSSTIEPIKELVLSGKINELLSVMREAGIPDEKISELVGKLEAVAHLDTVLQTNPEAARLQLATLADAVKDLARFDDYLNVVATTADAGVTELAGTNPAQLEKLQSVLKLTAEVEPVLKEAGGNIKSSVEAFNDAVSPGFTTTQLAGATAAGAGTAGVAGYWAGKVGGRKEATENFRDALLKDRAMAEALGAGQQV